MRADDRFSPERGAAAYEDFLRRFPAYAATAAVDELRARDYARLDRLGHVYLDYTGGGLYAESQVAPPPRAARATACSATRTRTTRPRSRRPQLVERGARRRARASSTRPEDEYDVVFTPNASGALKLVGESYPFEPGDPTC